MSELWSPTVIVDEIVELFWAFSELSVIGFAC
jgi:hypothetical protein